MEHVNESEQIQQEYSSTLGHLSDRLQSVKAGVTNNSDLPEEQRLDTIHDAFDKADEEHAQAVSHRNARFAEREDELRKDLFGAPSGSAGPAFTNALIQAHGADDEQLRTLAELAAKTSDKTLGKAVFAVAHQRNLMDIALPYLNSNPDALAAYREISGIPSPEERERAADFRFPRPRLEDLKPRGADVTAANRRKTLERMEYQRRARGG